jgi:hypothetical protein
VVVKNLSLPSVYFFPSGIPLAVRYVVLVRGFLDFYSSVAKFIIDEFDVFMDAVNRRISMKMMIETANTSDKKQYILITPQDMTNVSLGPTVRVLRMSDPERGNGMLPFAPAA